MEIFRLFVKKHDDIEDLDSEWVALLIDSDAVENGPRDLLGVEEHETMLTLSFKSESGLYYGMGRLDRQGIVSYRLDKRGSLNEIKRKLYQKRFMKNYRNGKTKNKILVTAMNSTVLDENRLWNHMNCLNGLCSVCVSDSGRYALLTYATAASVYYAVGYFENDDFYDVQVKMPELKLKGDWENTSE